MGDELPADPFETGNFTMDLLGHGDLIREALREASHRGALVDAIWSLGVDDLRAVVLAWILAERFRGRFTEGNSDAAS